jgi:hypothetical protein
MFVRRTSTSVFYRNDMGHRYRDGTTYRRLIWRKSWGRRRTSLDPGCSTGRRPDLPPAGLPPSLHRPLAMVTSSWVEARGPSIPATEDCSPPRLPTARGGMPLRKITRRYRPAIPKFAPAIHEASLEALVGYDIDCLAGAVASSPNTTGYVSVNHSQSWDGYAQTAIGGATTYDGADRLLTTLDFSYSPRPFEVTSKDHAAVHPGGTTSRNVVGLRGHRRDRRPIRSRAGVRRRQAPPPGRRSTVVHARFPTAQFSFRRSRVGRLDGSHAAGTVAVYPFAEADGPYSRLLKKFQMLTFAVCGTVWFQLPTQ